MVLAPWAHTLYTSKTVGVAELRHNLSRFLQRMASGEKLLPKWARRPSRRLLGTRRRASLLGVPARRGRTAGASGGRLRATAGRVTGGESARDSASRLQNVCSRAIQAWFRLANNHESAGSHGACVTWSLSHTWSLCHMEPGRRLELLTCALRVRVGPSNGSGPMMDCPAELGIYKTRTTQNPPGPGM